MPEPTTLLRDEAGGITVIALLMLALLTVIGISASNTSTTEVQITANAQDYQIAFYAAESGWTEGVVWLEGLGSAPQEINTTDDNIVKNFGGWGEDVLNDTFSNGTQDGTVDGTADGTPYWYRITYLSDVRAQGNDRSYRRFTYTSRSNAARTQQIDVRLSKIYRVGY
jgi:Tfp pilus assembly protein PilX